MYLKFLNKIINIKLIEKLNFYLLKFVFSTYYLNAFQ